MMHERAEEGAAKRSGLPVAIGCWVVLLLLTVATLVIMSLSQFSVCTGTCDFAAAAAAANTFYIIALLVLLGAAVGVYALRGRGWVATVPPSVGIIVVATAFVLTYGLNRTALNLPVPWA
jgi:peptidoglycan/LPS O-acetylase OafA/YrhL